MNNFVNIKSHEVNLTHVTKQLLAIKTRIILPITLLQNGIKIKINYSSAKMYSQSYYINVRVSKITKVVDK